MTAAVAERWEQLYRDGHPAAHYPYDVVVSFVNRFRPRDRAPRDISILEVGCGTGHNLWFCMREGYRVQGIDGSETALAQARQRLMREGLSAPLHRAVIGERLPFADATFDLAIDRAATACNPIETMRAGIHELARVLRPGGVLLSTVYTGECTGQCRGSPHYTASDIQALYDSSWHLLSVLQVARTELAGPACRVCSELIITARTRDGAELTDCLPSQGR